MDTIATNSPSKYTCFSSPSNSTTSTYQSLNALPRPRKEFFHPSTLPLLTGQLRNGNHVHWHRKRGRPRKYLTHPGHDEVKAHRNSHPFQSYRNAHLYSCQVPVKESRKGNLQDLKNANFREGSNNYLQESKNGNFQECRNDHFQESRNDGESRNDRQETRNHHFQESSSNDMQKPRDNKRYKKEDLQEFRNEYFEESIKGHLHVNRDRRPYLNRLDDVPPNTGHRRPHCSACLITNQVKLPYSEIIDFSPHQSWPSIEMMRDDVNGCLECYYGNAVGYPHKTCFLENGRCHSDDTLSNQNGAFRVPHHPIKVAPHLLNNVINNTKYGSHVISDNEARSLINKGESAPVIIECFSLSNERGHFKSPPQSPLRFSPRVCPDDESSEMDDAKLCDENFTRHPNIKRTGLYEEDHITKNQRSYCVQPAYRGFPAVPIVVDISSDNCFKSTPITSPHKPEHTSTTQTKEDRKRKSNTDVYEIYHSKYYKRAGHLGNIEGGEQHFVAQDETIIEVEQLAEEQQSDGLSEERSEKVAEEQHKNTNQKHHHFKNKDEKKVQPKNEIDDRDFPKEQKGQNALEVDTNSDQLQKNACSPKSPPTSIEESQEKNMEHYNYKEGSFQEHYQVNSKNYVCVHCNREFTHLSSLNNHVRTHTGQKPFKCQFCGKRFAQSGVLTAHLRTHTGDRPFECIICKKRFAQTTTLANHIRTHTGQKPFNCKFCKRKFAQSSTRNKHELSHTKEKPYICKYCGRSFAQSATVTRHMRIHMRQEAFVCVYCGKEFPYLHALDKHLDTHDRGDQQ